MDENRTQAGQPAERKAPEGTLAGNYEEVDVPEDAPAEERVLMHVLRYGCTDPPAGAPSSRPLFDHLAGLMQHRYGCRFLADALIAALRTGALMSHGPLRRPKNMIPAKAPASWPGGCRLAYEYRGAEMGERIAERTAGWPNAAVVRDFLEGADWYDGRPLSTGAIAEYITAYVSGAMHYWCATDVPPSSELRSAPPARDGPRRHIRKASTVHVGAQ